MHAKILALSAMLAWCYARTLTPVPLCMAKLLGDGMPKMRLTARAVLIFIMILSVIGIMQPRDDALCTQTRWSSRWWLTKVVDDVMWPDTCHVKIYTLTHI